MINKHNARLWSRLVRVRVSFFTISSEQLKISPGIWHALLLLLPLWRIFLWVSLFGCPRCVYISPICSTLQVGFDYSLTNKKRSRDRRREKCTAREIVRMIFKNFGTGNYGADDKIVIPDVSGAIFLETVVMWLYRFDRSSGVTNFITGWVFSFFASQRWEEMVNLGVVIVSWVHRKLFDYFFFQWLEIWNYSFFLSLLILE